MANDGNEPKSDKTGNRQTYDGFMAATKWGVIAVAVVLLLMAIFLV